ncbi:hypothetical protein FKP32DRAFT_1595138 [Trametes sanguinea]|nr:hypothetical protein FKP32DRAFT_1595138 [Trametes sanguinea]
MESRSSTLSLEQQMAFPFLQITYRLSHRWQRMLRSGTGKAASCLLKSGSMTLNDPAGPLHDHNLVFSRGYDDKGAAKSMIHDSAPVCSQRRPPRLSAVVSGCHAKRATVVEYCGGVVRSASTSMSGSLRSECARFLTSCQVHMGLGGSTKCMRACTPAWLP